MISRMMIRIPPTTAYGMVVKKINARALSTNGIAAVDKLKSALEDYRVKNYAQCMPSRFKKELLSAMAEKGDRVPLDGMQRVLANINMADRVSRADMEIIFKEIGGNADAISKENLMKII